MRDLILQNLLKNQFINTDDPEYIKNLKKASLEVKKRLSSSLEGFEKKALELELLFRQKTSKKIKISACHYDIENFSITLFNKLQIELPVSIRQSLIRRQAEFLAGRIMAKQALKQLRIKKVSVAIGKHRSPVWPFGIIGSISHSDNIALCIVGEASQCSYLGCDVESYITNKTQQMISDVIINLAEKQLLLKCNLEHNIALTLTFSAKESVFKALYPSIKRYFDFRDVEIFEIDTKNQNFKIKLLATLANHLPKNTIFNGFYILSNTYISTFIIL